MNSRRRVVFVRHALPVPDATVPSELWKLADEGRRAAHDLAAGLQVSPDDLVMASAEVKAQETAAVLSDHVVVDPRLGEVRRPWADSGYRELAEAWLQGRHVKGWEPMQSVVGRMDQAVAEATNKASSSAYLVTHGLSMSAYIGTVTDLDPLTLWSDLDYPDVRTVGF